MAYMTHAEAFTEMWSLTREWDRRSSDCQSLAFFCMEAAAAGEPCEREGLRDYALAKYVRAMQDDKYAPLLAQVFACYVQHGIIDPNQPMRLGTGVDCLFRGFDGEIALEQAVLKGNMHVMELLVRHGADTSKRVSDNVGGFLGEDFFDFVRMHYGETCFTRPTIEKRAEAAARLLQVAMQYQVQHSVSNAPAESAKEGQAVAPSTRRRARI